MNARGQTSVEYIMMVMVVVVILNTVMKQVKDYVLGDSNNCTATSTSIVCKFKNALESDDFRYFTLRQ